MKLRNALNFDTGCDEAFIVNDARAMRRDAFRKAYGHTFKPVSNTCGNARCISVAHAMLSSRKEIAERRRA